MSFGQTLSRRTTLARQVSSLSAIQNETTVTTVTETDEVIVDLQDNQ